MARAPPRLPCSEYGAGGVVGTAVCVHILGRVAVERGRKLASAETRGLVGGEAVPSHGGVSGDFVGEQNGLRVFFRFLSRDTSM